MRYKYFIIEITIIYYYLNEWLAFIELYMPDLS